jgi:hypothetical protein
VFPGRASAIRHSARAHARRWLVFYAILWSSLCLFFVVFGGYTAWHSYVGLPHAYARLRAHGVRADASLVRCAPGLGGGRGVGCRLSLRFEGRTRAWNYPENSRQFESLPVGSQVPVLVDPSHPTTVYTVRDVERGTNTGLSSPVLWLGVVFAGLGLAGLAWLLRFVYARPLV